MLRPLTSKFVPGLLGADQKQQRLDLFADLTAHAASDPSFLSNVIKGDEIWVYNLRVTKLGSTITSQRKRNSSKWKIPQSPRAKTSK